MDEVRFTVKDALAVKGVSVVLIGQLEAGVVRIGDTLFLKNDDGCFPIAVLSIEQFPTRSFTEASPSPKDYGIGVTGLVKEQIRAGDLVTNVGWGGDHGDRSRDFRTTEELWAEMEKSGATSRYTQLLNGITIEGLQPYFDVAPRVLARPELLEPVILDPNWRVSLCGTAMAVLVGSERPVQAMIDRLAEGSWVAPQLAAGIGSLPTGRTDCSKLLKILQEAGPDSDPRTVLSACAALEMKGGGEARAFEATDIFAALWKRDDLRSYGLASRWRGIWRVAGPYFRMLKPRS